MSCKVVCQIKVVVSYGSGDLGFTRNLDLQLIHNRSKIGVPHTVPSQAELFLAAMN